MTLRAARTRDEAVLFLELNPCESCGSAAIRWNHGLVEYDGRPATRYDGICSCGAEREVLLGHPDRTGDGVFGGPEPSQLIDAGQWWWVADRLAGATPPEPRESADALRMAAAALDEVLKFVPSWADEVPESAFWSELGTRVRSLDPGRFRRDRLIAVRDTYRSLARDRMLPTYRPCG